MSSILKQFAKHNQTFQIVIRQIPISVQLFRKNSF